MSAWIRWLQDRLVYLLLVLVLLLSGAVAYLLFKPQPADMEWRTVNAQMEQTLTELEAPKSDEPLSRVDAQTSLDTPKSDATPKPKPSASPETPPSAANPLNLNSATAAQLEQLPGIGPSKAQAILELRTKLGGFTAPEQLLEVKGIGPKTFEKLRSLITTSEGGENR
jgi:competence protein ComEA